MALFKITDEALVPIAQTDFAREGLKERSDLQRLLRDRPDAIEPDLFIVSEEYGDWEDSRRRIDLLGVDSDGRVVVIELKRTDEDLFMDLQAIRYAAMVSQMTFDELVRAHEGYLAKRGSDEDPRTRLLRFLGQGGAAGDDTPEDILLESSPRIILVAPGSSRELITSVLWLNDHDIDIRCMEVKPHRLGSDMLLDVTQVVPLPQASDYHVRFRQKAEAVRAAQQRSRRERTIRTLVREGKVNAGDAITVLPSAIGQESLDYTDSTYQARFANDPLRQQNIIWEKDQKLYALSTLCEHMRDSHGLPFSRGGINGYTCWSLEHSSQSLWDLAEQTMLSAEATQNITNRADTGTTAIT